MQQFRPDIEAFERRTRRRVCCEISFLLILLVFFLLPISDDVPEALEWAVIVSGVLYILVGVAMYAKSKRMVEQFSISLLEGVLSYTTGDVVRTVPYKDIEISRVKRDSQSVSAVYLRTPFGQSLVIKNLQDMDGFYARLRDHLSKPS